jgi:hypothetical protein
LCQIGRFNRDRNYHNQWWPRNGTGAGIGTGAAYSDANVTITNITIFNGTIVANGVSGAGIGAGIAVQGTAWIDNIVIFNGNISARSTDYGTGIGGEDSNPLVSKIRSLLILNGTVWASGDSGYCGIGVGYHWSEMDNLMIFGGNVSTQGSLGIGFSCETWGRGFSNLTIFGGNLGTTIIGVWSDRAYGFAGSIMIARGISRPRRSERTLGGVLIPAVVEILRT